MARLHIAEGEVHRLGHVAQRGLALFLGGEEGQVGTVAVVVEAVAVDVAVVVVVAIKTTENIVEAT